MISVLCIVKEKLHALGYSKTKLRCRLVSLCDSETDPIQHRECCTFSGSQMAPISSPWDEDKKT
jgi:hypothetical protein